jgi:hypothetical protein
MKFGPWWLFIEKITLGIANAETASHNFILVNLTDIGWAVLCWTVIAFLLYLSRELLEDLKNHWRK